MKDLNVLIPTIPSRQHKLERLLESLNKQRDSNLLISVLNTTNKMTIGAKRNAMISQSDSRYISFIDDDDLVSDDYISNILTSIDKNQPDAIGFKIAYFNNGTHSGVIDQSMKYKMFTKEIFKTAGDTSFFSVKKPINHLNPVKTNLVKSIGFPDISYGEDKVFSLMLQSRLKSEDYIDKYMYHYLYDNGNNSLNTFKNTYINPFVSSE